jgi:hypothetical protein
VGGIAMKKYVYEFADIRLDDLDLVDVFIRASDEYSTKIKILLPSGQAVDIYVSSDSMETPSVLVNLRNEEGGL